MNESPNKYKIKFIQVVTLLYQRKLIEEPVRKATEMP